MDRRELLLALCALEGVTGKQWQVIARQATSVGGLEDLRDGVVREHHRAAQSLERNLARGPDALEAAAARVRDHLAAASSVGAELVTVLDDDYPAPLRAIRDRPPFLFYEGNLALASSRSIAVVGTRQPSDEGLVRTRRLVQALTDTSTTVASGMAAGIDTAAHESALAHGMPTVAVMGTGVMQTYPRQNQQLRERIADAGLVVTQFWPSQPPGRHTFPMRNVITSGISTATIVVEASDTSGARLQARIAAEQGRTVLLLKSLVEARVWASEMVDSGRASIVDSPSHLADTLAKLETVQAPDQQPEQDRLDVL